MFIKPIKPRVVNIENFEHYTISFWGGIIYNTKSKNVVKGWVNTQGYRRVKLCNQKITTTQYIHRVVALTWVPNPKNKPEVNHINKIRYNCDAPNLNWLTHAENMAYIKCELYVEVLECPF